ncbi:GIY-YIG catalytic domain-containing protein [Sediminihabitans luteus]|uniref:GIY-YIG catalytic domain-containing protein n=1 Tax=Sediminihabitans luteus TaxID=1138585 RepID=A0A2M9CC69_9CELL|nr:GIY-YIG nuclease family protein [Sediminihabitans luteus]PJJ68647.1 GIY-YIG catalytic domain-containing protein [Sediminihabitans luteus]GII99987.1 hypothetical protein Slu03_23650 [Sediminihabitans luteus]
MNPESTADERGVLNLGHLLDAAGIDPATVLAIRHTSRPGGLPARHVATPAEVFDYTRSQAFSPSSPPLWLLFWADGGTRSRLLWAYENHGAISEPDAIGERMFDLRPSQALSVFNDRLVVEWTGGAINWSRRGAAAASFPVVEIADPAAVPFPGYDRVLLTYGEMRDVVNDLRYAAWQTALEAVHGVYLISDKRTGKQYVGKADGGQRILGRWKDYASTGHGGDKGLVEIVGADATHRDDFVFSILRVFGPSTPQAEILEAESHYKQALLTRHWGYNHN